MRLPRKPFPLVLLVLPLLVFMSAEEAGGPSAALDFIGKAVNFVILFGGLAFVLRKRVAAMLARRGLDVQEALRAAEAARREAVEKLAEADRKNAALEEEVRRMTLHAEVLAERGREKIAAQAEAEARRIRQFAQQEIEHQTDVGLHELRAFAADRATSLARDRIRRRLTPEGQSALIDKSIERLAELHEKSGSG